MLRKEELRLKIKFQKNVKELGSSVKKLENSFPEMDKSPALKKQRKIAEDCFYQYSKDLNRWPNKRPLNKNPPSKIFLHLLCS